MTFLPRSLMRGMEGGWKFRPSIADVLSFVHCGRNYVRSFVHRLPLPRYFFTCCGSLELSSTSFSPPIRHFRFQNWNWKKREREREARAGETEGDGEEKGGDLQKGGIGPKSLFSVLFLSLSLSLSCLQSCSRCAYTSPTGRAVCSLLLHYANILQYLYLHRLWCCHNVHYFVIKKKMVAW